MNPACLILFVAILVFFGVWWASPSHREYLMLWDWPILVGTVSLAIALWIIWLLG